CIAHGAPTTPPVDPRAAAHVRTTSRHGRADASASQVASAIRAGFGTGTAACFPASAPCPPPDLCGREVPPERAASAGPHGAPPPKAKLTAKPTSEHVSEPELVYELG
ncbi:hypothetical protein HPB47_006499, partial [Ixodes persulcatus]